MPKEKIKKIGFLKSLIFNPLCGAGVLAGTVIVHQLADAADINVHRAEAHTATTAHTLDSAIVFVHIIFQFMHESLPHAMNFCVPGIVAGAM